MSQSPLPSPHELQHAAYQRAKAAFDKAEVENDWSCWIGADKGAIPPWWEAGAEYVWTNIEAKAQTALASGQDSDSVRALCSSLLVSATALSLWHRFRAYEPAPDELPGRFTDLARPTSRQLKFVKFVWKKLSRRLTRLLQAGPPLKMPPAPQPARQIEKKREMTVLGRNIDRLRKECGWSFNRLAEKTSFDKKQVLRHVNQGAKPHPKTVSTYAKAFSIELRRTVSVAELETDPDKNTPI